MVYEFKLPDIGEGVVEGEIIRWLIRPGEQVSEDQPMVEVMTDKATVEIPSPVSGRVTETVGEEGDTVQVGGTMVVIETSEMPSQRAAEPAEESAESAPPEIEPVDRQWSTEVLATPAVRKLAREQGIDLAEVPGSGPGGRITRQDLDEFRSASGGAAGRTEQPEPGVESVPYRGLRKRIGDHLVAAKRFAPHYTYVEEVDATRLVEQKNAFQKIHPETRLTYLPFLVKAVIIGLRQFPFLNATLDEEKQQIHLKKYYNIGIATATKEGLIVPVVRNADQKSILELSDAIAVLSDQARQGKVSLEDLKDGTFTVTSLGPLGGVFATPIINYPEVAILGVHKIEDKPVVQDGRIVIRKRMNLSLSLDHRVVDGMLGARFMQAVIPYIENPGLLAIG